MTMHDPKPVQSEHEHHDSSASEVENNSSDADVESNAGDMADSSWVSLNQKPSDA